MKIKNIKVNKILDSRGELTIEVEIESEDFKEKASIPSGKSVGSHEAICLDCEKIEKNLPEFLKEVKNFDFSTSQEFDNFLIERAGNNKGKLGANFILGCSISFVRILAKKSNLDLWEYLKGEYFTNDSRIDFTNESRIDLTNDSQMGDDKILFRELSYKIMKILFDVHKKLGNSFKEEQYKQAIESLLAKEHLKFEKEKILKGYIEGIFVDNLRVDFIIENKIILEIKTVPSISLNHIRQIKRYILISNIPLGIVVNFRKKKLEFKRILNPKALTNITSIRDSSLNNIRDSFVKKVRDSFVNPKLVINIIGGGVHSFNNLDFQEYWLVTKEGFSEKLIADVLNVINNIEKKLPKPLGRNDEGAFCTNFSDNYEPFIYLNQFKENFELGADIAANQIKNLVNWKRIYEKLKILNVVYLEDPYQEDEFEKFAELKKEGFKVVGDDLTVTNIERLKIAIEKDSVNGVIVKPNQIGTIKETFEVVKLAKENNLFTIFSHRSGETNDNWIIDLGIAFEADYFKIGVPLQGERVAKWNRLIEINKKFRSQLFL